MADTREETIRQWYIEVGRKGGNARAKALTPEQRSAVARKAGKARWRKHRAKKAEVAV